jgi:hypothetical protein
LFFSIDFLAYNGAGNQRAKNYSASKDFNDTRLGFFPSGSPAMLGLLWPKEPQNKNGA